MTTSTTQFDLERARDLRGRHGHVWNRRFWLLLMAVFVGCALAGQFGQSPSIRTATGDAAEVRVHMPETIRGGLMYPVRIEITARESIAAPQVVLGSGFIDGMHLNTLEPAPTAESSRPPKGGNPGSLALTYPSLDAGDVLTVYLQLQVNPTTVGSQDVSVSVEGPGIDPVRSPATLRVLP